MPVETGDGFAPDGDLFGQEFTYGPLLTERNEADDRDGSIGRSSLEGDRKRKARNAHRYGTEQQGHPSGQGTDSHDAGKNHEADRNQDSGQMSARLSDNRLDICPQGGQ